VSTPSDGGAGAGSGPAANEPRPAAPPTGRRASWSSRKPAQAAPVYIACYLAIALIGGQVVGWIRPPLVAGIVVTLMGAAVLLISLLLVLSICRVAMHPHRELAWILGMSILFSLVRPSVCAFVGKWLGFPAAGMQIAKALSIVVAPGMALLLGNAVLMVWAAFLGKFVSRVIREGKLILPVAAVASLADIITVFWGVVAHLTKTAPEVVQTFSATAPVAPPPNVTAPILSAVGIGDFLFFSLFLAVALRYAMRPTATMWATFAMMLVAPFAFLVWPSAPGMPGLPFISAAALWANWRYVEFTREEKRALAFTGALVLAAAFGFWAVFHR
jgi:hypothetical protein